VRKRPAAGSTGEREPTRTNPNLHCFVPIIDDLHERAGSRKLIHMRGELAKALCMNAAAAMSGATTCRLRCPALPAATQA
jgi:NAD-dependent SIR2 family protein deacetylase